MSTLTRLATRFLSDQDGAEVTEVGLYLALIVLGCIALLTAVGPIVLAKWQAFAAALGI